jgi:hypothetical protein
MGADDQIRTRFGGAQEDETAGAILVVVAARRRLVPRPFALYSRRTSQTPALQAHRRQVDILAIGRGQDELVATDLDLPLLAVRKTELDFELLTPGRNFLYGL